MSRIERIEPERGSEPVRLTILTREEREQQRREREARRRSAGRTPRDDAAPGDSLPAAGRPAIDEHAPRRLDLRA